VEDSHRVLIDGGILNNLPVKIARDMGASYVIAVDLSSPSTPPNRPQYIFDMWPLTIHAIMRARHLEAQTADVLIQPDVAHVSWLDFRKTASLVEKGREAALAELAHVKSDLGLTASERELREKACLLTGC
jgi:NTE family protein